MGVKRKVHSAEFKAKVALETLKGKKTINELAAEYGIHPNLVTNWKKQLQEQAASVFQIAGRQENEQKEAEELQALLYQQIGQLKVELDWLKKNLAPCTEEKRKLIEQTTRKLVSAVSVNWSVWPARLFIIRLNR